MNTTQSRKKTISYNEWLKMQFDKDPQEVLDYLNAMLGAPEEPELFLLGLQRVAKVFGMEDLANQKGFESESSGTAEVSSKIGHNPVYSLSGSY